MKKIVLTSILCASAIVLTACDPFERLKKADSVSLVSMDYLTTMKEFDEDGNEKASSNQELGVGEAANMLGGFLGGNVAESTQDVLKQRQQREKETMNNYDTFQQSFPGALKKALSDSRFKVKPFTIMEGVDIKNSGLAKGLLMESKADVIMSVAHHVGYIKRTINFGLTKEYELVIKTSLWSSDKDGFIGDKYYWIKSGVKRTVEAGMPVFTQSDFDKLERKLMAKIKSELLTLKLGG